MTYLATITSKGQMTIPKDIREYLGLTKFNILRIRLDRQRFIAEPVKKDIFSLKGSVRPKQKPEKFKEIRRIVRQKLAAAVVNGDISR